MSLHRSPQPRVAEGAGIVISPRQVLTCRHVVDPTSGTGTGTGGTDTASTATVQRRAEAVSGAAAGDAGEPSAARTSGTGWWVVCHQHRPLYATIAVARVVLPAEGSMADLALLELVAEVPDGITPAPVALVDSHHLIEDGWWAFGHPGGDPFGNTARGVVGDVLGFDFLRLDLDGPHGEQITPGFSGAGLWSPTHQAVVAVVAQHGPGGGGRAVAISQATAHLPGAVFAASTAPTAAGDGLSSDPRPAQLTTHGAAVGKLPPPGTVIGSVPVRPTPWIDRPEALTTIQAAFDPDRGAETTVCLVGPGGAGKSHLAGEYTRRLADAAETVVAWLGAETSDGLRQGFAALGRHLGIAGEDPTAVARRTVAFLSQAPAPVLLVLDNAESLGVIEPYLPGGRHCRVLITTRDTNTRFSDLGHVIELAGIDPKTATDFLTAQTGITLADAKTAAGTAQGLPLVLAALVDAPRDRAPGATGASITIGDVIVGNTLSADHGGIAAGVLTGGATAGSSRTRTDRPDDPTTTDPLRPADPVAAVITATATSAMRTIPGADTVLRTLAVLSPEGTSRGILAHATSHAPHVDEAVDVLAAAGLLTSTSDGLVLIHRRTADTIRELDPVATALARARAATGLDTLVADRDATPRLTDTDHELLRHVRELTTAITEVTPPDTMTAAASLGNHTARLLRISGDAASAITLSETLQHNLERDLGPDHPDTLASRNNLANAYRRSGRHRRGHHPVRGEPSTDRERVLGPDHPDTLTSRNNLAVAYRAVGPPRRGHHPASRRPSPTASGSWAPTTPTP